MMHPLLRTLPLLLLPFAMPALAAETFGTVDAVVGSALVRGLDGTTRAATLGATIVVGERVETGADGEVHLVTADAGFIAVRPSSQVRAEAYRTGEKEENIVLSLFKGALRSVTGWVGKRNPGSYQLKTSTATIGIRGTDHEATVVDEPVQGFAPGTVVSVREGVAILRGTQGEIDIESGRHGFLAREGALAPRLLERLPEFLERRALRIEDRVEKRKAALVDRIKERIAERRADAADDADDDPTLSPAERAARAKRDAARREVRKRLRERNGN